MSPIALALDGLLAGLLLLALIVGVRLNARLKALRDSHVGFARCVAELDAAAVRAETALAALRSTGEQTHDQLLARIETARALAGRLEALTIEAPAVATGAPARPNTPGRADARRPSERSGVDALEAVLLRDEPARTDIARSRPVRRPSPEDDLFETADARPEPGSRPEPAEVVELIRRALGERR